MEKSNKMEIALIFGTGHAPAVATEAAAPKLPRHKTIEIGVLPALPI